MIDKQNTFFNTKRSNLSLLTFLIAMGVLIILFGVGAAFDLDICINIWEGLGHQEIAGRSISSILSNAQFFFIFSIAISFAIASVSYWKEKKWVPVLSFALAVGSIAFLSYFQYECFFSEIQKVISKAVEKELATTIAWALMALAWVLCYSGAFCFSWFFINKRVDSKLMVRAGLFLILASCFIVACNNYFLKFVWSRPRPSAVIELGGDVAFRPVWEIHPFECFNKDLPYAKDLKSFPSGLVSGASVLLISVVGLTSLNIFKTKKVNNIYLFVSLGFVVIVGFARLMAICHFLTDVSAAAIIGLLLAYFMPWCYKRSNGNLLW